MLYAQIQNMGGNCRALEIRLPAGRYALATDDMHGLPTAAAWWLNVYENEDASVNGEDPIFATCVNACDPAADESEALALLALADFLSPKCDPGAPIRLRDEAQCLADPERGDEARAMLDDLSARCGFPADIVARVWLWTADRDSYGQAPQYSDGGRTVSDEAAEAASARDFWETVLADSYHVHNRG